MTLFNQMRWELRHKSANTDPQEVGRLQTEISQLKVHLEQSSIDRENLQKQLNWQQTIKKNAVSDNWTPFPTIARKFSDSEGSEEVTKTSQQVSVVSKSDARHLKR